jgi:hypothetical protein
MMLDYAGMLDEREERKQALGTVWVHKGKGAAKN